MSQNWEINLPKLGDFSNLHILYNKNKKNKKNKLSEAQKKASLEPENSDQKNSFEESFEPFEESKENFKKGLKNFEEGCDKKHPVLNFKKQAGVEAADLSDDDELPEDDLTFEERQAKRHKQFEDFMRIEIPSFLQDEEPEHDFPPYDPNDENCKDFESEEEYNDYMSKPTRAERKQAEDNRNSQPSKPRKSQTHPYCNKPLLKREDLRNFIQPFPKNEEIASPLELFLHILWQACWEEFCSCHYDFDDEGNRIEMDPYDGDFERTFTMEGFKIPARQFEDIAANVLDDIQGAVQKKRFEAGDESIPVDPQYFQSMKITDLMYIIYNWYNDEGRDPFYCISSQNLLDIEADDLDVYEVNFTKDELKDERKYSRALLHTIISSAYEDLTPIERVIQKFLKQYIVFDVDGQVTSFNLDKPFKNPEYPDDPVQIIKSRPNVMGNHNYIGFLLRTCHEENVELEVFYSVLLIVGTFQSGCDLKADRDLFSYTKLHNANQRQVENPGRGDPLRHGPIDPRKQNFFDP